jgi:DNA-binding NtrC family response regulator
MTLQGIKQRFGIIGRSPALEHALSKAVRVAPTDLTVMISGESGVGKEVFSKVIHSISPRKHNSFIAINCGAIPEGTINSELFGHEKGAFTGATAERKGYFETVDGGTIFLDEVAEMPLDTQAFLLRVLESGEFIRVGSSVIRKTDVRVIAATNVDLLERIKEGKFREDLYYRLNTVPIDVPPLRERKEDIMVLFRKFAVDFAERYRTTPVKLDEEGKAIMLQYRWPGNIRELKNVAEQASVFSEDKIISMDELLAIAPRMVRTNRLPAIIESKSTSSGLEEREILYKLLFEMKSDLNDLKSVVSEVIKQSDISIEDDMNVEDLHPYFEKQEGEQSLAPFESSTRVVKKPAGEDDDAPYVIRDQDSYDDAVVIEENLSLEEMEKQYISKALLKHGGRRRDAAKELGISERTLYRKIKEYDLQ